MIRDLDIYRSANVLIRDHGEDVAIEAAIRAEAMLAKGDIPMSAMGQKQTSREIAIYVRYWGQSGHPKGTVGISRFECPLSGVKRTFASGPLDVCL